MFNPNEYCVFDVRVWQTYKEIEGEQISLEQAKKESENVENYKEFLHWVRKKADQYGMTPREIEVTLWHYNKYGPD